MVLPLPHIDPVACPQLHRGHRAHPDHPATLKGKLQLVEDQQHISRSDQHPRRQFSGHATQRNQKLIENRGSPAIGQDPRHPGKELAAGRAVGQAPRITARVDDQHFSRGEDIFLDLNVRKRTGRRAELGQHPQGRAP